MFVLANFMNALAIILHYVLTIYMWIVVARAILSWVNPDPANPIVRFLYDVTEPVFYKIRQTIPLPYIGIDLSPIIVFVIIIFLDSFLVGTIQEIAARLH